ncbi:MAG: hypothetical protein GXP40_04870 [Chloroflexi bacterium]|nr:hypothetical protein [Chloroflexota bacterium]
MCTYLSNVRNWLRFLVLFVFIGLTACGTRTGSPATPTLVPASQTPAPPTATSVPMAAIVNDEGITMVEFQAELERFQASQTALGNDLPADEAGQRVLDDLIDQVLLAQGARAAGFELDEAVLQSRLDALAEKAGGADALSTWQADHGYTSETFRLALRRAIEAAWMRDQIISAVPSTAEQVHVQQILLYNEDTAREVQTQLTSGADFDTLAATYDPVTRGELGWFPRGYLLEPKIEEAAFALQAGQVSDVIVTDVGFHIIMLVEREMQHPLSPDAYLTLQDRALMDWLRQQRTQSTIELSP